MELGSTGCHAAFWCGAFRELTRLERAKPDSDGYTRQRVVLPPVQKTPSKNPDAHSATKKAQSVPATGSTCDGGRRVRRKSYEAAIQKFLLHPPATGVGLVFLCERAAAWRVLNTTMAQCCWPPSWIAGRHSTKWVGGKLHETTDAMNGWENRNTGSKSQGSPTLRGRQLPPNSQPKDRV